MNEIYDAIIGFEEAGEVKDELLPNENIRKILKAGTFATLFGESLPVRFSVVNGEGIFREAVSEATGKQIVADAPGLILVFINNCGGVNKDKTSRLLAAGAAVQNMLLCAYELGYGASCVTDGMPKIAEYYRNFLPSFLEPIALIAFGIPKNGKKEERQTPEPLVFKTYIRLG